MQADQAVLGVVERLWHGGQDLEAERLPQVHRAVIGFDDGVELDAVVASVAGPVDQVPSQCPADSAALMPDPP